MEIRKGEAIKDGSSVLGNLTNIKVVKNKVAPPFKTASVEIIFGQGISKVGEIVDLATEADIIHKSGAWFSYNGEKIGQGRENTKQYLLDHPDLMQEIEQKVRSL